MTDRKLLELAAKAAGYDRTKVDENEWFYIGHLCGGSDPEWELWNPLTDDGDALRLAVNVLNWPHGGRAFNNAVTAMYAVGKLPSDPYAATRRAIVRAAAEIGKTMQ